MSAATPEVAIVGMGCLFPGAPDLDTYWDNILAKVNAAVSDFKQKWAVRMEAVKGVLVKQ